MFLLQLDDWVLCRVRQKSGVLRNAREDRNGPCYEPGVQEPLSMDMNPNLVTAVKNYLYNDCPMLPYIFASDQEIPFIDATSSISCQSSNSTGKSCPFVFEDNTSNYLKELDCNLYDTLKRKLVEGNQREIFVPPSKKVSSRDNYQISPRSTTDSTGMKFCDKNNLDADQWNSFIQYQEFDHLVFTE